MAYCNISDAFNINSKFEDTVKGMRSFNPATFEMSNVSNSYGKLTNIEQDYDSAYERAQPWDDCGQSLNGTDLSNLISNTNQIKPPQNTQVKKLTHRNCIEIYTNPKTHSDTTISNALKHITKCSLCKQEIKRLQSLNSPNTSNTLEEKTNTQITPTPQIPQINPAIQQQIQTVQQTQPIPVQTQSYPDSLKIENKLQQISNRINEENNLKYQNSVLQNTISKYMEDAEEKKQFNCKVDKILELLQQKQNIMNSQYGLNTEHFMNWNNNHNYGNFRPEMFGNYNNGFMSSGFDWVSIGIVIIIILLLIDIYLRIRTTNAGKSE